MFYQKGKGISMFQPKVSSALVMRDKQLIRFSDRFWSHWLP